MSHYSVAVFEDPNGKSLEELLAPYDENLECPHYISKAELISKSREKVKRYEETTYARYLEDPKAYKESTEATKHILSMYLKSSRKNYIGQTSNTMLTASSTTKQKTSKKTALFMIRITQTLSGIGIM